MSRKTTIDYVGRTEINEMLNKIDRRQEIGGDLGWAYFTISALTIATGFINPIMTAAVAGRITIAAGKLTYILSRLGGLEDKLLIYKSHIQDGIAESVRLTITWEYWDCTGIKGWVPINVSGQLNQH